LPLRRRAARARRAPKPSGRRTCDLHQLGRHPREILKQLAARIPHGLGVRFELA